MRDKYYFETLNDDFQQFMDKYDVERRKHLVFRFLGPLIIDGAKTLEIGCGTGEFSRVLSSKGAELTVLDVGFNLTKSCCGNQILGVVGDACKLPFASCSFELCVSSECIEHTAYPVAAIREICRVCKPGGLVVLTTPNLIWKPVLFLAEKLGLRKFRGIENWILPGDALREMEKCGMSDIKFTGCHLFPFQVKFARPLLRFFDGYGDLLYPIMINFGVRARKSGA